MALIGLPFIVSTKDELFHFNRAEGAYLGYGMYSEKLLPRTALYGGLGYAFGAEYWQWRIGANYELLQTWPLTVYGGYHDHVSRRATVIHRWGSNMTLPALWNQTDPLDYFKQRGFALSLSTKLVDQTRLSVGYSNFHQQSIALASDSLNSDYSFFGDEDSIRANPAIADGHLRTLSASFSIDTRPRMLRKGKLEIVGEPLYSEMSIGLEHSSPDLLKSDFDFTTYDVTLFHRQRTLGMGVTSLWAYYGASDKPLPPQRYFTMEYSPLDFYKDRSFKTLNQTLFAGDRLFAVSMRHEFRRALWVKSGIPVVKKIPWWLSVHGGAFWSDFKHQPDPDQIYGRVARKAYSEIGFSLGNLTPFISPFNFSAGFTWQLSAYETSDWTFSWGIEF